MSNRDIQTILTHKGTVGVTTPEPQTLQGYVLPHAAGLTEAGLLEKATELAPAGCSMSQAVLRLFKDRDQKKALIGRMIHDLQLTVDLYEVYARKPHLTPPPPVVETPAPLVPGDGCYKAG